MAVPNWNDGPRRNRVKSDFLPARSHFQSKLRILLPNGSEVPKKIWFFIDESVSWQTKSLPSIWQFELLNVCWVHVVGGQIVLLCGVEQLSPNADTGEETGIL